MKKQNSNDLQSGKESSLKGAEFILFLKINILNILSEIRTRQHWNNSQPLFKFYSLKSLQVLLLNLQKNYTVLPKMGSEKYVEILC